MCTVIDADTFSYFCDWIETSSCKIVYGGTHYENHLESHRRFRGHLAEQEHKGKTKHLNDDEVDHVTDVLKENYIRADFNDHHIVALVLISRCKLVCSVDNGLRNLIDSCYSSSGHTTIRCQLQIRNLRKPSIYSGRGSAATIRRRTFCDNCGPCSHT